MSPEMFLVFDWSQPHTHTHTLIITQTHTSIIIHTQTLSFLQCKSPYFTDKCAVHAKTLLQFGPSHYRDGPGRAVKTYYPCLSNPCNWLHIFRICKPQAFSTKSICQRSAAAAGCSFLGGCCCWKWWEMMKDVIFFSPLPLTNLVDKTDSVSQWDVLKMFKFVWGLLHQYYSECFFFTVYLCELWVAK